MNKLITIVGPTAVGKTDLTLSLAEDLQTEVISGDAYQIYRGLSIGTAKPSKDELQRVPHHLIDILEPTEAYSVAEFQKQAEDLIIDLNREHKIPILSGGTGFYVQSLLEGYNFSGQAPDSELRKKLDTIVAEQGLEALVAYGQRLADKEHMELPFTDKHRLYRAIELMEAGDYDALRNQTKEGLRYEGPVIGLLRERELLYERINLRVDLMVQAGLWQEVEHLLDTGLSPDCQAFKGIGYKEVAEHLLGHCSKEEAIESIKQNTRRFAKRQITWYKRMPYIQWIMITPEMTSEDIVQAGRTILENSGLIRNR